MHDKNVKTFLHDFTLGIPISTLCVFYSMYVSHSPRLQK
jgi:hypothetical protein